MSNSPLVNYTKISPNKTSPRNIKIDTITIHCVVGQVTVEQLGETFAKASRKASSNYGIGKDGKIGMYVEEKDRSWCSGGKDKDGKVIRVNGISGADNDHRAITIEVASDTTHPYAITEEAYKGLIELLVDICKRNDIKKLKWKGDKSLVGKPENQNLTVHRWFANTSCPGKYLYDLHGKIAQDVNSRLGSAIIYRVQTGAFRNKDYAIAELEKVKKSGFKPCMIHIDGLYKVQVGAYTAKANAEKTVKKLEAAGFKTCISTKGGAAVPVGKKSIEEIAKEVIQGKWGNGSDRKNRLIKAGYDFEAVQKKVNELM